MAHRIVGLDIATSAVRAVELTIPDSGPPVVEAYGQVGLPVGAVVDGEILDRTLVAGAIQKLWREGGFVERRVAVGVAGLRAITRELDMPLMPPKELDDAIRFKADEVVPFPLDRTAVSGKVIAQYTDEEGNQTLRVLVAAAHLDLIDSIVATVNEAGLEPASIDLDTAALVRALQEPGFHGGTEAIVSVGASLTLVVVHDQGNLQFVRTIDVGGETVTQAIGGALDIPELDAELVKRRMTEGDVVDDRARSASDEAVEHIVDEIHNSIRFFSSLPGRGQVARVMVTGGGSRAIGFLPKLQQSLDIEVVPASAMSLIDFGNLPMSREQAAAIAPTLPVPVGLALPEPSGKTFNLLPSEVVGKQAQNKIRRYTIYAAALIAALLVVLTVVRVLQVHNAENQVSTLTTENAYISNVEIPKYDKVVSEKAQVLAQRQQIAPELYGEVDWLVPFNELGKYTLPTATDPHNSASWSTVAFSYGTPGGAATTPLTTVPSAATIIATASGTAVANANGGLPLTAASSLETSLSSSSVFSAVQVNGSLSPGIDGSVSMPLTFDINGNAHSQRLSLVTQPIP